MYDWIKVNKQISFWDNMANLRDLITATGLVSLLSLDSNCRNLWHVWPSNLMDDLEKQQGTCLMLCQAVCIISKPSVNSNWSFSPEKLSLGENRRFFVLCELDRWHWKTIRRHFSATSSFVHHFKAICELKLELKSGNIQLGSKLAIFLETMATIKLIFLSESWCSYIQLERYLRIL